MVNVIVAFIMGGVVCASGVVAFLAYNGSELKWKKD